MGLLDDLEQAAVRRKQEQEEQARQKDERDRVFRLELEPALSRLHDFFARLLKSLTDLKPERIQQYELPGYGTVYAQILHDYKLSNSGSATMREVRLDFIANVLSDRCPLIEAQGATRVRTINQALQKARLTGIQNPVKDASGEVVEATFRAKGRIPLSVHWIAEAATGQVKATFANFEDLTQFTKVYAPAQFTEELFETFAHYITREDNALTKESIPDKLRQSLRTKVQQEEIKRKWEEKLAQQRAEEEAKREEGSQLGNRLKQQGGALLDKIKTGIGGWLSKIKKN